ncbi:MAG: hypothetical protein H7Z40_11865 [Phycisphaerae bacterium]|nr:hypothetical protein [Gemmatimonadaceae bacterium]
MQMYNLPDFGMIALVNSRAAHTKVAGELVRVRLRVTAHADRQLVLLDDVLPAGLEAVDLSMRTAAELGPLGCIYGQTSVATTARGAGPLPP